VTKRYYKYHIFNTHNTNDCKVFRDIIQQTINKGKIGLEKAEAGMGIEDILSQQIWFLLLFQEENSRYSPFRELRKQK